jgi:phenylacetate-coenzyme A ligase PaaK-like adenylate-forming protein
MFREAGFNADTFSCLEDIERIPFTDKECFSNGI